MRQRFALLSAASDGSTALESAIALPILLTFGFVISQVANAMWIQNTLQFAVEAAARCAAINSVACGTDANIQSFAASQAVGTPVRSSNFTVTTPSCGKQVAVTYAFNGNIPLFRSWTPSLRATACHAI
jgi:Flp pilus assembly protein TadG